MKLNAYSIFDNKALVYQMPFFAPNDGHAVRAFGDIANSSDTLVGRHPGDFSLFHVGEYDDQNASLSGLSPLRHVIDAVALVRLQPAPMFDVPKDLTTADAPGWLNGKEAR